MASGHGGILWTKRHTRIRPCEITIITSKRHSLCNQWIMPLMYGNNLTYKIAYKPPVITKQEAGWVSPVGISLHSASFGISSQKLKTSASQRHNLAFPFISILLVRFDAPV